MIAVAARNDQLELNNGNVINISTYGGVDKGLCYAKGTNRPVTVFRIVVNDGDFDNTNFTLLFGGLTDYNTEDYYEQETILNKIAKLDDGRSVHWLWGSMQNGGCYVRKVSAGRYRIGGVSGMAHRLSTDEYAYVIREANRDYISHITEGATTGYIDVCFMYDGFRVDQGDEFPLLEVFSLNNMVDVHIGGRDSTYYAYALYNQITYMYGSNINCDDLYDPTRYITWEGTLGDKPSMVLFPQWGDTITYPYNLHYPVLGFVHDDDIMITKGNMWGDAIVDEEEEDPSGDGGYSTSGGGGFGDYPSETGNIDFSDPTQMAINVINSGFVTLYNPSLSEVKSFNDWLFNDITDAISGTLKKLIADPIDYVLFLSLCHFTPPNSGAVTYTISYAGINTTVTSKKITNQFAAIDCGTIHLNGDTQTFLDYNPNTKISIYLPYIGINDLNSDDVVGASIHVMYYVDLLTGACIAQIKCTRGVRIMAGDANLNDVLYSFSGNCYEQIPITGTDWRGLASSIMQGVSGAVSLATGNLAGAGAIASAVMSDKSSVSHSGNMGGSFGYMDNQKPYLILERPINNLPYNYRGFKGYTLNQRRRLGSLKGYTEIEEGTLWTDSFNGISKEEAEMLKQITATGFYL